MQSLKYKSTREVTLKTNYKSLRTLYESIKSGKDRPYKSGNTNKISIEEFKTNQNSIENDSHIKYSIHVKTRVYNIIDINDMQKYQATKYFTNDNGEKIGTKVSIVMVYFLQYLVKIQDELKFI